MARCRLCHSSNRFVSGALGVCVDCIRRKPEDALAVTRRAHQESRQTFDLPTVPPQDPSGRPCRLCVNNCRIPRNGAGYCGIRKNAEGRLSGVSATEGKLSGYHDPLPTNCVGDWVCAGGTGAGYPRYANRAGPERGFNNLAVFFHACSFNCLFCQNWHFREKSLLKQTITIDELVGDVSEKTSCICYFGGDPGPQLPFALHAARRARRRHAGRVLRICWETNGAMHERLLDAMLEISLASGGCVKFDLKAYDDALHVALTGITNRQTLKNFGRAGKRIAERPDPPPLIASTLLVPGYIDAREVERIAAFIAAVDRDIPYSLLAFYPKFFMSDLPTTSRQAAHRCLSAAQAAGLRRVRIGNLHLLR